MTEEQLTPEESAALTAMEADPGDAVEVVEDPVQSEQAEQPEKRAGEPEGDEKPVFKSTRTDEKPPEGFVPHQAMHAERIKRQEVEQRLRDLESRLEKANQPPPPEFVDPLEDPAAHRRWAEYQSNMTMQEVRQIKQQIEQQQVQQRVLMDVQQSEAEFAAKAPDYSDAVRHLYQTRASELQGMGYGQNEVQQQIQKDAQAIYQAAKFLGMNPAEMAYMRAQSLGYQRNAAPKAEISAPAPQGQTETQKVVALARAQEAASGISATGAPNEGQLTVAQLAKMSEAELAKIPDDQVRKIMGG